MAQNPEKLKKFQMGLANMEKSVPIIGFYDFTQLNTPDERTVLVDVGGGAGQSIVAILEAHPELAKHPEKFVLQDLTGPIEHSRTDDRLPEGVKRMVHDFYTEQPVKGLRILIPGILTARFENSSWQRRHH